MRELIRNFGIDWKLLLAQAVNFFILLFILQRFAYKPILGILRKRKQEIEKGLAYTKKAEVELNEIDRIKAETINKAHADALGIVSQAEDAGKKRKAEMMLDANKKVAGVISDAKRLIGEERAKMGEEVYRDAQQLVYSGIAKVLGKMKPDERDALLVDEALQELKAQK